MALFLAALLSPRRHQLLTYCFNVSQCVSLSTDLYILDYIGYVGILYLGVGPPNGGMWASLYPSTKLLLTNATIVGYFLALRLQDG